jgi:hypothetical protein
MNGQRNEYFLPAFGGYKVEALKNPSSFGIVEALVHFNNEVLFKHGALDNEEINQFDSPERDGQLVGKSWAKSYAGYIPLSLVGEIDPSAMPGYPSIKVAVIRNSYTYSQGLCTIGLFAGTYDQDKDQRGWVDLVNIMDALTQAYFYFDPVGDVASLAKGDENNNPISWEMVGGNTYPYFFALMTAVFNLITPVQKNLRPPYGAKV